MAVTKLSRKDISKMSTSEVFRASREPYRKLLSYLRPYLGRFSLGILFGALFGATNGLLIFTIKHVAAFVFPSPDAKPIDIPFVGSVSPDMSSITGVVIVCATIPTIMLLRGLFSYLNAYCMLWVSLRVLDDIRKELFARLMSQSLEFFNRMKAGELIQTVFNQTRMAQTALTTVSSDLVKQPVSIIGALAALLWIDWRFTLGALLLFPLCLIPVIVVGKKVRKSGAKEEEEAGMVMVLMQEAFAGIRVVKSHAREDYEIKRFNKANAQMLAFIMRWRKAMEIVGPLVESVASIGAAAALLYAWYFDLGIGTFMALSGGLLLLYPPFKALSKVHIMMQKCLAATTKVFDLMERQPAIEDAPDARPLRCDTGLIEYKNVTFSYVPKVPAVTNITLTIPPGTTCALVGASGAGKSTLLALLLRLYEADEGSICIDGEDIRSVTQSSLRENIGIVTQDTFLFHDTILANIRYGRLNASREEVEAAANLAHAHGFIMAQPEGYDSIVGDKGCMLSGGQQQRISIARALLKNAPILLLDEATSALDSESEKQIQSALERLRAGRTVIAIAHRLSTVLTADQIAVMEAGQICDVGHHDELYESSLAYRRLYDLQFQRRERREQRELSAAEIE
jgi:subfamily B ATP-binding cassette protein MsbA